MIELVQGEGGINIADKKFVKDLRKLCDDKNLLLICDEIQCGLARTGKTFAWQHYGIKPDIFTLAKAIANGLPLGAVVADKKVAEVFNYGDHGSTFGGNPVSCAAAVATLKSITPKLLKDVTDKSKYFVKKLKTFSKTNTHTLRQFVPQIQSLLYRISVLFLRHLRQQFCHSLGQVTNRYSNRCAHQT